MDFSDLNKATANSFNKQKAIIKKVLAGQSVYCPSCKQLLVLKPSEKTLKVECLKGCTDIQLETE
ncbi:hypothetical protein [Psychrosphaera haliotis]|uniref:hypothetical protein n=1 Tax=Psychrosphaera haliotis TaxID=555083 RepID=UPI0018C491F0|nr:hypothetical protein [Psychrosphaera haliotis]